MQDSHEPREPAPKPPPDPIGPGLGLHPRPRVTRLNRRLLVLLGLVAVAVVTAAILTLKQNEARLERAGEGSEPRAAAADPFWRGEPDGIPQPTPIVLEPEPAPKTPSRDVPQLMPAPPIDEGERARQARVQRAQEAAPLVPGFQRGRTDTSAPGRDRPVSAKLDLPSRDPQAPLEAAQGLLRQPDPTIHQNDQASKVRFLAGGAVAGEDEQNPHFVRAPASPYEVTAGTIIPAVLVTRANSDLPGMMTARVRENVYDSATGRHLLIPQGTTIVGLYDSVVTYAQERLLVSWQRLLFPDGRKLNIGSMPGADLEGSSGFADRVNHHYWRVFGSAALLSALSAGFQVSQGGSQARLDTQAQDIRETLAAALGQQLGEVSTEILRRNMNIQPRIEIRAGYRFNVFVQKDLVFPAPYRD